MNGGMRRIVNRNIGRPFPSMQVEKKTFSRLDRKFRPSDVPIDELFFSWYIKRQPNLFSTYLYEQEMTETEVVGFSTDGRRPDDRKSPRLLDTTPDPLFVITIVFGLFFATL